MPSKEGLVYMVAVACLFLAAAGSCSRRKPAGCFPRASPSLDYEPRPKNIFRQASRHARCVVCHSINNAPLRLVQLRPGARLERRAVAPELQLEEEGGRAGL